MEDTTRTAAAAGHSPQKAREPEEDVGASAVSDSISTRVPKREGYLSWEDYFVAVAFLSAQRSKDPSTQVGACIVDESQRIVGIGYNGLPRGVPDDAISWAREADDPLDTKYPFVAHAEMNAILNKNTASIAGARIYVALFPCNECAKLIIQSGIREVVYVSDKHHDATPFIASRRLLDLAGVRYRQHVPTAKSIVIDFSACL